MSTFLRNGAGADDWKCSRDQRLNVPYEARHCLLWKTSKNYHIYLRSDKVLDDPAFSALGLKSTLVGHRMAN
jgi:hypothetical protein